MGLDLVSVTGKGKSCLHLGSGFLGVTSVKMGSKEEGAGLGTDD